jgi:hypothetical protein
MAEDSAARHQALGVAAGAIDNPDASAKSESYLRLAESGALQQQRPGIRRECKNGSEENGNTCQQ